MPTRAKQLKQVFPRRRIHRAFLRWLSEMQPYLATPLRIASRTDRCIELCFPDKTASLRIYLTTWEIIVAVEHEGKCWDLLADFDAIATRVPAGYICKLCDPKAATIYPSREALWTGEIFDPFGDWINGVLSKAHAIAIYQDEGTTWAELISQEALPNHPDATHLIPINVTA